MTHFIHIWKKRWENKNRYLIVYAANTTDDSNCVALALTETENWIDFLWGGGFEELQHLSLDPDILVCCVVCCGSECGTLFCKPCGVLQVHVLVDMTVTLFCWPCGVLQVDYWWI